MLQRTPLYDWHHAAGGRLVDFAGWEMPLQYATIVEEHQAVRQACGLFDISHMGRLYIRGAGGAEFLNRLVSIDVTKLPEGRIRYALAMNESGGIRDDVLIYRLADEFLVVVNASNREKILAFWGEQQAQQSATAVEIEDRTFSLGMIAVQGPDSLQRLTPFFPDLAKLKYYRSALMPLGAGEALVSRTGYTGENGFEVVAEPGLVVKLWQELLAAGEVLACGLGCRDTLRLEAGMPLYGHELTEEIDPLSAGLEFAVHLDKPDFLGKKKLEQILQAGLPRTRIGLELKSKRIAREHATILNLSGELVGEVTSGTFSPTLQKPIAMGYVVPQAGAVGSELVIDVRGTACPAYVTPLPFYQTGKD